MKHCLLKLSWARRSCAIPITQFFKVIRIICQKSHDEHQVLMISWPPSKSSFDFYKSKELQSIRLAKILVS